MAEPYDSDSLEEVRERLDVFREIDDNLGMRDPRLDAAHRLLATVDVLREQCAALVEQRRQDAVVHAENARLAREYRILQAIDTHGIETAGHAIRAAGER
jgi:hypothetical protein